MQDQQTETDGRTDAEKQAARAPRAHAPEHTIGVMDSGLGGLSVLRRIAEAADGLDLLYFADTAFCPYGNRSLEEIRQRTGWIADHLIAQGAGLLVVACNTASAAALEWLRDRLDVPVVGMEPAVKPAAITTNNGKIGVLATPRTLEAERFAGLLRRFATGLEVFSEPALDLVEAVEAGTEGTDLRDIVRERVAPFVEAEVDTVVLGCTHYPFVAQALQEELGPQVTIIDPGPSVAAQTLKVRRSTYGPLQETHGTNRIWFESSADCSRPLDIARVLCPKLDIECGPRPSMRIGAPDK